MRGYFRTLGRTFAIAGAFAGVAALFSADALAEPAHAFACLLYTSPSPRD